MRQPPPICGGSTPPNFAVWAWERLHVAAARTGRGGAATGAEAEGRPSSHPRACGSPPSAGRQRRQFISPRPDQVCPPGGFQPQFLGHPPPPLCRQSCEPHRRPLQSRRCPGQQMRPNRNLGLPLFCSKRGGFVGEECVWGLLLSWAVQSLLPLGRSLDSSLRYCLTWSVQLCGWCCMRRPGAWSGRTAPRPLLHIFER